LAAGAGNTVAISLLAIVIGTPLGLGLALIRWGRLPGLDPAVAILVSLLRATPAVTLVLLVYFALPTVGLEVPRFAAGVATLTLGSMAYNCEIWRAALLALPHSACHAACASVSSCCRRSPAPHCRRWSTR
jgi:His/Glu/Gln/Arg/opine family amino acid ABC transporter permease subunit